MEQRSGKSNSCVLSVQASLCKLEMESSTSTIMRIDYPQMCVPQWVLKTTAAPYSFAMSDSRTQNSLAYVTLQFASHETAAQAIKELQVHDTGADSNGFNTMEFRRTLCCAPVGISMSFQFVQVGLVWRVQ